MYYAQYLTTGDNSPWHCTALSCITHNQRAGRCCRPGRRGGVYFIRWLYALNRTFLFNYSLLTKIGSVI